MKGWRLTSGLDWPKRDLCSFSKVGFQHGQDSNLRKLSPLAGVSPHADITRQDDPYVSFNLEHSNSGSALAIRPKGKLTGGRFLTLEQLKKGVDKYRESGGTLI